MCRNIKKQVNSSLGRNIAKSARCSSAQAGISLGGPAHISPGQSWAGTASTQLGRRLLPRLGRDNSYPGRPASLRPGWADLLRPRWAVLPLYPGWAGAPSFRLGRQAADPGVGRQVLHPSWAGTPPLHPGWARVATPPRWAARPRAPPGRLSTPARPGFVYSGQARPGFPWPRPEFPLPGRITSPQAGLTLSGPGFTPSGTFPSSGIDSIVMSWSWDASWLRLAHSTSLYAGLGMPLGSDQRTPHQL
jgi:hypothetical protein